jgi:hypothetical protein
MPKTSPRVSFGLFALEIKQDGTPSASGLQPFSKISDLRTDNATSRPYATYEPDFWLLDGGYKFLPANTATVHVGMMSAALSDQNGLFGVPPVLTVSFRLVHTTDGLTLKFMPYSGDYASSINVKFYDAAGALIRSDDYLPTATEFTTGQAVADFKQIVITFLATNRPYRYLRVSGIDYGELITFEGSAIRAASVVEEVDMLSAEVPYNTLELQLYSPDAAFSIINPSGIYASLTEKQPLSVHEIVDNGAVLIGQYYLDTWANTSDTEISFSCIDLLGVLDGMSYRGGIWLGAGIALHTLIEGILEPIYAPYDLDIDLFDVVVRGWIPICSYREALQQIAFAAGASVDCSRSGAIKIYASKIAASDPGYSAALAKTEQGLEQSLALKPQVTGVEVTAHNYLAGTEIKELYNDALPLGVSEITFDQPMHTLAVTGATILDSGVNYARLNVAVAGTVVLTGKVYTDTKKTFAVYNPEYDPALGQNAKRNGKTQVVSSSFLVSSANGAVVAQRVYDYAQQRYLQKLKLFAPTIQPGDVALVDSLYNRQLRGVVEKMETDLAGGFLSDVTITGVIHE